MPARVDAEQLFGDRRPLWLEIGFGAGEHLARQAAAHPEIGMLGCEPYVNGVAMALGRIEALDVGNIRIHAGDARDLLDALADRALERLFLLYPDPWPKTRHHKRRFMSPENLAALGRVAAAGAELRLATDIAEYADHALAAVAQTSELWQPVTPERERHQPWPDWTSTRYEVKALRAGRRPQYLSFFRR